MEIKVKRSSLEDGIGKVVNLDDCIIYNGNCWLVTALDVDISYIRGGRVRLNDENIPLSKLNELEKAWNLEEDTNEMEWLNRGVIIYTKLLEKDPESTDYQYNLGSTLFDFAIHMKRNEHIRSKAKSFFDKVIHLSPNQKKVALSEYQLGFLHLYEGEWKKGIFHFERALESGQLDHFQKLRAYCNLGICYGQVGEREQANRCISNAKEIDSKDNRYTAEIQMASLQVENGSRDFKPYTLLTKGAAKPITEEEARDIVEQYEEEGFLFLDCRGYKGILNGQKDSKELSPTSVLLLKVLMTKKQPLSYEALSDEIYSVTEGMRYIRPEYMRQHIFNVRKGIESCMSEKGTEVIKSVKVSGTQSYQWNSSIPYQIILPYEKQ
jgi:tetratricopeptide (TPR) repeat protein